MQSIRQRDNMKVKHLEVSGFRGFAETQAFDMSADAVIIVGANGLGKTSLCDAIQWALTGKLSRIHGGDHKLVSMYSPTGQARVAVTLGDGTREIKITRVFDGDSQSVRAHFDGHEYK